MRRLHARVPPGLDVQARPRRSFSELKSIRFDGNLARSAAFKVYDSPSLDVSGNTRMAAYVQLRILDDTGPAGAFALMGSMVAEQGSATVGGAVDGVWWVPPLPPAAWPPLSKWYEGAGVYRLALLGPARGTLAPIGDALAITARFELRAVGGPADRVMRLQIEGLLIAGESF